MELNEACKEQYINYLCIINGRSHLTASSYWHSAVMYADFLHNHGNNNDRKQVESWLIHLNLHGGHKANSSRANRLAGLRSVCRWMTDNNMIDHNPTLNVPSPRFHAKSMVKFSAAELTALFAAPDRTTAKGIRDRAILLLYYITGMRRNEMCNIHMHQLKIGAKTGRIAIVGKGGKSRTVSFEGINVIEIIIAWLTIRNTVAKTDCQHIFCNMNGDGIGAGGMRMVLKNAAKLACMDSDAVFLHKLRATYATDLYDANIDIKTIQLLMGHSRIETTLEYIVISERHMRTARLLEQHTHDLLRPFVKNE